MMAAEGFAQGNPNSAIVKELRVSVRSVQRWRRSWNKGAHGSAGSALPPRLGEAQFAVPEAERQTPNEELSVAGSPQRPHSDPC